MGIKIFFHVGAFRHALTVEEAYSRNELALAERGILYPRGLSGVPWPDSFDHTFFSMAAEPQAAPSLDEAMHIVMEQVMGSVIRPETLVFSHRVFFQTTSRLRILRGALLKCFPQADFSVIFTLSRQDLNLETQYCFGCLTWYPQAELPYKRISRQNGNLPGYDACLAELSDIFGWENIHCIVDDGTQQSARGIQENSLQAIGITQNEIDSDKFSFPSLPSRLSATPEFYYFANLCRTIGSKNLKSLPEMIPWLTQEARFLTPTKQPIVRHSFLHDSERSAIIKRFSSSNNVAAKMLGRSGLFEDPLPQEEAPFRELTPELALSIASRLDPEFVKKLLEDFSATPNYYHTRDQRIAWQGLHEALDSVSSAPVFWPQPASPKLSVLTLTYNHAKYIEQNITSVIEQAVDFPVQHIIADDGSNDGTQDIIIEYAKQHSHIVPIFQRERSYGANNIRALFEMARSPYVALCDGDDYFTDPLKLQTQVDFLDAHPDCALCFHPVRVTYEDDPARERFYPSSEHLPRGVRQFYYLSDLCHRNFIQTNSVMYRWRFQKGLPDWFRADLLPGDWYWHLLHAEKGKIGFINTVMSVYRRHSASIYNLAEIDRLKHRDTVGRQELEVYDVINTHFERRFEPIFLRLADSVFADCSMYCKKIGDNSRIEELVKAYPHFAKHFLHSLENLTTTL